MATSRRPTPAKAATIAQLNLNSKRVERAKARAARRAEQGKSAASQLPIFLGVDPVTGKDQLIATLGPELPLDAFEPLLDMDIDLPTLIAQLMQAIDEAEGGKGQNLAELVIATVYTNPTLPRELVTAARKVGEKILTRDGMAAFLAEHPSGQDIAALGAGLLDWYGVDLGELLGSSPSATDGGTSDQTSPASTPASTSAESGDSPAMLAS